MTDGIEEDQRLVQLTQICLALPETSRVYFGIHSRFLVRNKAFAYFLNNHHDNGIVALSCKVAAGLNSVMAAADPTRFYLPAYLGANGWVGLRLDAEESDWDEVRALVHDSYRLQAPKRLAALIAPSAN